MILIRCYYVVSISLPFLIISFVTPSFTGSGLDCRNESDKNIEMRAPNYSSRGPKTGAPKIQKCQKDISIGLLAKRLCSISISLYIVGSRGASQLGGIF